MGRRRNDAVLFGADVQRGRGRPVILRMKRQMRVGPEIQRATSARAWRSRVQNKWDLTGCMHGDWRERMAIACSALLPTVCGERTVDACAARRNDFCSERVEQRLLWTLPYLDEVRIASQGTRRSGGVSQSHDISV